MNTPAPQRIHEALHDEAGFFFYGAALLDAGQTPYQSFEVWNSPLLGTFFRLDGAFMTSERDEFFYHENLIHPAAITHPEPRNALIIGGGDGGAAEELLKHPSIEHVSLVELDGKVIEIARTHLQAVHRGALDNPRLRIHVTDGLNFVRQTAPRAGERFDLIILDLTDPVGPAAELYTEAFLRDCKALLTPGGAMTLHVGAPFFHPDRVRQHIADLDQVFHQVTPLFVHIPLYGALWGMAIASDTLDPLALTASEVEARIRARGLAELQYYNGNTHHALAALPNYIRQLLGR